MKYHECIDYLESLQQWRPEPGTETTARLLAALGEPQAGLDCVQVAGSNGKGSTARMLESVLRADGLDVGLFTSPGLTDIREQIRVNGREIPKARLAESVAAVHPCVERLSTEDWAPTHFEVVTALALHHFGRAEVDVAILEVGIGGRYDATSAVDPVASAVTSVSLEHTDLLGDTVEAIGRDKAQVAPEGRPLVTGTRGDALEAIRTVSDVVTVGTDRSTESPTDPDVVARETGMRSPVESEVAIAGPDWSVETPLPLLGAHQATNAGIAATLARQVAAVDADTIRRGLRRVTWPCRFEIVSRDPTVVLDGSHNPGAAATLASLVERYDYDDLHVVFGAMADKDHEGMVDPLPPVTTAFTASPDLDRAAAPERLAAFDGHARDVRVVDSVPEATEAALDRAAPDDFVLVTGSLYAVSEARDRWTRLLVPKLPVNDGNRETASAAFSGATFDDRTTERVDQRVFRVNLRPDQAETVATRLHAVGGDLLRSGAGAPQKLVACVVRGTVPQLRALAADLSTAGEGLSHLASQLQSALAPGGQSPTDPFDVDGTAVMGILNVTPDSFHDGGAYDRLDRAVARAEAMVDRGADIVDVGGESSRPGADPVPVDDEIDRVVPVIEALSSLDVPLSIDTRKAAVADAALSAGADIVDDVSGLSDPEMRFVVSAHDASLILKHSLSTPVDPDRSVTYDDVVDDVLADLSERVLLAERAGIDRERIVVDPGCGFGKSAAESFELIDRLPEFRALGCPVMVGHSHKSMFETVDAVDDDRLPSTLAVTAMAAERGADVVRVHDVAENAAVVDTVRATRRGTRSEQRD